MPQATNLTANKERSGITMRQTAFQAIWLNVGGMRIHCLTAGESDSPIVFLHGAGADSATLSWGEVIGLFSRHHRVFAPDLPGYGQSSKPDIQYTMDFYVQFVEQLLDVLQQDQIILVGLSMGGAIALALTLRSPKRVEKLVLVDPYGIQDKVVAHRLSYLYVHLPFLDELSWWLIGRSRSLVRWSLLAGIIYNPARLSDELVDRVYQAVREPRAGKAYISFQRSEIRWAGLQSNFTTRLREIAAPTLLVYGAQDRAVPLAAVERAHTLIPHSQLCMIQECRHWPQGEKPEEFTRVVGKFLDL
jgi:pimeloyl-ACP methyl ester carboxylesterase